MVIGMGKGVAEVINESVLDEECPECKQLTMRLLDVVYSAEMGGTYIYRQAKWCTKCRKAGELINEDQVE